VKKIAVLGSTGSIGQSTLSICESHPDRFHPIALAAGSNLDVVFAQCQRWRPEVVSVATEHLADELRTKLKTAGITGIEVVHGTAGTVLVATLPDVDFVVAAIVGVAGLEATYAAVLAGKTVGLANKECLVAAGDLILAAARAEALMDGVVLGVDGKEVDVVLAGAANEVKQIWLTASGGPFRNTPLADFDHITPAQALKHPTWVMGQRITIDSATMLNKGLEIIEACRLFNLPPDRVKVTVHPQSTIHSLVEYIDGSILAQVSVTDMRLPILYALSWPDRVASDLTFDMAALAHLDFQPPDFARFPCLRLAYEAAAASQNHCIALNAADEIAVAAFLAGHLPFNGIPRTIERVLALTKSGSPASIPEVLAADLLAREQASELVAASQVLSS
jgi:1-deoxy-D-xylulose-5-phosphate reductoisomerase